MSSLPAVTITIEGEFIDSYIYSGSLFLVDMDGVLKTYQWKDIVNYGLKSVPRIYHHSIWSLLIDSRVLVDKIYDESGNDLSFSISVDADFLSNYQGSSINLDDLPTDFSIFSNRLYIASENGVESRKFDWNFVGQVREFEPPLLLWDEMSFRVSPNSMNRIAIAAGKSGLLTAAPHSYVMKEKDLNQITDIPCSDCDWQESILVASTIEGCIRADFESLSTKSISTAKDKIDWKLINDDRRKPPSTVKNISIDNSNILFSWLGGDRMFAIDEKFQLYSKANSNIDENFELLARVSSDDLSINQRLLAIRSSVFGTLAEFTGALLKFSEDGVTKVADSPGRWRVFPRAKNYANHLHIVEDYGLRILAFNTNQKINGIDKFGFAFDSLSENDPSKQ